MSKDDPLSVDLRMFPERPATMNTPEPERLSEKAVVLSPVVAVVSVEPEVPAESSLPPQEMMVRLKKADRKMKIIYFIIQLITKV